MYLVKPDSKKYAIHVLGGGGTGSWLCSFLDKMGLGNDVIIYDGDIVEPKNILRQNFSSDHVNSNKAEVLAERYNMSSMAEFITSTDIFHEIMDEFEEGTIPMLIGCLDNNASRKLAHDFMQEVDNAIWIDGGNAERHGQTYISIKENGKFVPGFESPLDIDEVFQNFAGDERRPDQISCAEHSESAPQNVTANVTSATLLFNTMALFLKGGIINTNKITFNTVNLSMEPHALTI